MNIQRNNYNSSFGMHDIKFEHTDKMSAGTIKVLNEALADLYRIGGLSVDLTLTGNRDKQIEELLLDVSRQKESKKGLTLDADPVSDIFITVPTINSDSIEKEQTRIPNCIGLTKDTLVKYVKFLTDNLFIDKEKLLAELNQKNKAFKLLSNNDVRNQEPIN